LEKKTIEKKTHTKTLKFWVIVHMCAMICKLAFINI